jgi:hypothetical protein
MTWTATTSGRLGYASACSSKIYLQPINIVGITGSPKSSTLTFSYSYLSTDDLCYYHWFLPRRSRLESLPHCYCVLFDPVVPRSDLLLSKISWWYNANIYCLFLVGQPHVLPSAVFLAASGLSLAQTPLLIDIPM